MSRRYRSRAQHAKQFIVVRARRSMEYAERALEEVEKYKNQMRLQPDQSRLSLPV
jgi:hypothetical protein